MDLAVDLAGRWDALGVPVDGGDLLRRWTEPHRRYHDQRHLLEVLGALERLSPDVPCEVQLAAWYHDAVHEGRADDERRSAVLAASALAPVAGVDTAEVVRLVLLTATHDPAPGDRSGELLCDADLAILAASPQRYAAYTRDVRAEYAHVPDADFAQARSGVLRGLLAPERVYRTPVSRSWERRARANVEAELAQLSAAGTPAG